MSAFQAYFWEFSQSLAPQQAPSQQPENLPKNQTYLKILLHLRPIGFVSLGYLLQCKLPGYTHAD